MDIKIEKMALMDRKGERKKELVIKDLEGCERMWKGPEGHRRRQKDRHGHEGFQEIQESVKKKKEKKMRGAEGDKKMYTMSPLNTFNHE